MGRGGKEEKTLGAACRGVREGACPDPGLVRQVGTRWEVLLSPQEAALDLISRDVSFLPGLVS